MALKQYQRMRDFSVTPEPRGGSAKVGRQATFVVQKHAASRLHYDFRLALEGTLKSWAIPKGPSLDPSQKRLAVQVEDHPLEYADFEGVIPRGQYGGGTVMVWDRGLWSPLDENPARALERGKLSFTLDGEKLRGTWTLARIRGGPAADGGKNWLLIKHDDEFAERQTPAHGGGPALSVKTGRDMDQIARGERAAPEGARRRAAKPSGAGRVAKPRSPRAERTSPALKAPESAGLRARGRTSSDRAGGPRRRNVAGRRGAAGRDSAVAGAGIDAAALAHARPAPMPRHFRPQLCVLAEDAPEGEAWLHEIKFDGYRLLCHCDGGGVRLITRAEKDWTDRFPPIVKALEELPVQDAIVDGEATILDPAGRSSFQQLQQAIKARRFDRLAFFAFDLPYCNGYDLTAAPLRERKALLQRLIPEGGAGVLRFSDHVIGHGVEVHAQACKLGLEGIVSKHAESPYAQARTRNWLKVKCGRRQEFVVIGWTPPAGTRKHFGALLLGARDAQGRLVYVGRVGTGFDAAGLKDLAGRLAPLAVEGTPADVPPTRAEQRGVRWVRPRLVAEVEFSEWTDDGRLRHPAFVGLREDKEADEVTLETPDASTTARVSRRASKGKHKPAGSAGRTGASSVAAGRPSVADVLISNPDRVLYPEQGLTKLDLARYYDAVADHMLPYVVGRPLSTVRCPKGRTGQCFFQKHMNETLSEPVRPIAVREKGGSAEYIGIDSRAGLVTLVQFGVLEIHPWGARADDLERPDVLTFDLDPGEGVEFSRVAEAALRVRAALAEVGLESFVKTSGGKGLHVVVPLQPRASWAEAKGFARAVSLSVVRQDEKHYVATSAKALRRGRIFIDYLRNDRGATSVAPFSTRAREGAPVSMPLGWEELENVDSASAFTVRDVPQRLARLKDDPWRGYFRKRQQLTPARLRRVESPP